jgi:protein-export membrane protein SecD
VSRNVALLLAAAFSCSKPEGGVKLVYAQGADAAPLVQKRLKALNLRSSHVVVEGETLAVYVPGGRRLDDVKESLRRRGALELTFVKDTGAMPSEEVDGGTLEREPARDGVSTYVSGPTREAVEAAARGLWPQGRVLVEPEGAQWRSWLLEDQPVITGANIADAIDSIDTQTSQPVVDLTLDDAGKAAFGKATGDNVGRRLAIIVDDRVMSAPVVQSAIPGGHARITLGAHAQLIDSRTLASALKSGALPRPLVLQSEEQYPPRAW